MKINHLGIIPDGNRRWARSHKVTYLEAYTQFIRKTCLLIKTVEPLGVKTLSIYILSKENLSRPYEDVYPVLLAVKDLLCSELPKLLESLPLSVRCIGVENTKNTALIASASKIQADTRNNTGLIINLLIGYSPVDEIGSILNLSQDFSLGSLLVPTPVDLVIRTAGGPIRLSNFLPLQCGYANIEVIEKYFPDISSHDIESIIKHYEGVAPKYGQ